MLLFWTFYKNPENIIISIADTILSNVSWESNQHMISEESCDTEDWSNDAENSALITGINYILFKNIFYFYFLMAVVFHNITDCTIFFIK